MTPPPCHQACPLPEVRTWATTLRDDLTAYARDRDPERRSISPALMLVRLKPLLDLIESTERDEDGDE